MQQKQQENEEEEEEGYSGVDKRKSIQRQRQQLRVRHSERQRTATTAGRYSCSIKSEKEEQNRWYRLVLVHHRQEMEAKREMAPSLPTSRYCRLPYLPCHFPHLHAPTRTTTATR